MLSNAAESLSIVTQNHPFLNQAQKYDEKDELEKEIKKLTYPEPGPRYVQFDFKFFIYLDLPGSHIFWISPGPPNPLWWTDTELPARQGNPSHTEQLMCDCVLLSIFHDDRTGHSEPKVHYYTTYEGRYFRCDDFVFQTERCLKESKGIERVKRAWERVKPTLPKEPTDASSPIERQVKMANIPAHWHKVAEQVDSILLDYPDSISIFRERAEEIFAQYQRYLVALEKVNPAEVTEEQFNNPDTLPDDIDEMALKTIPRDPIRGSEYYRRPATKREELSEQYTALAVLHDSVLEEELQESQVILTDKSFACLMVKKLIIGNKTDYDEKFYQDALDAVKADLARLGPEETDSRQGKFGFHPKEPSE